MRLRSVHFEKFLDMEIFLSKSNIHLFKLAIVYKTLLLMRVMSFVTFIYQHLCDNVCILVTYMFIFAYIRTSKKWLIVYMINKGIHKEVKSITS